MASSVRKNILIKMLGRYIAPKLWRVDYVIGFMNLMTTFERACMNVINEVAKRDILANMTFLRLDEGQDYVEIPDVTVAEMLRYCDAMVSRYLPAADYSSGDDGHVPYPKMPPPTIRRT